MKKVAALVLVVGLVVGGQAARAPALPGAKQTAAVAAQGGQR